MVEYRWSQSTERPTLRHISSNAFSSSSVSSSHSSMKLRRLTGIWFLPGFSGGRKPGS